MFGYVTVYKPELKIKEYEAIQGDANAQEKNILTILEMCNEMQKRGFQFLPVDLYKSDATKFLIEENALRLPFTAIKGLGGTAAETIITARQEKEFFSKEDIDILIEKTPEISKNVIAFLTKKIMFLKINQVVLF